jgi:hypothetical protein
MMFGYCLLPTTSTGEICVAQMPGCDNKDMILGKRKFNLELLGFWTSPIVKKYKF